MLLYAISPSPFGWCRYCRCKMSVGRITLAKATIVLPRVKLKWTEMSDKILLHTHAGLAKECRVLTRALATTICLATLVNKIKCHLLQSAAQLVQLVMFDCFSWPSCRPISTIATIGTTSTTHQTWCEWSVPCHWGWHHKHHRVHHHRPHRHSHHMQGRLDCLETLMVFMLGLFILSGCHYDVTSSLRITSSPTSLPRSLIPEQAPKTKNSCSHTSITTLSATFQVKLWTYPSDSRSSRYNVIWWFYLQNPSI